MTLKGYSTPQLYSPAVNLELGTRYFRDMVDKYNGQFEYALEQFSKWCKGRNLSRRDN